MVASSQHVILTCVQIYYITLDFIPQVIIQYPYRTLYKFMRTSDVPIVGKIRHIIFNKIVKP